MEASSIIAIVSVGGTVLTTLITTLFTSMSLSRCKNISCCFDFLICDREVVSDEVVARQVELTAENNNI
jgi:hypothetical protein